MQQVVTMKMEKEKRIRFYHLNTMVVIHEHIKDQRTRTENKKIGSMV